MKRLTRLFEPFSRVVFLYLKAILSIFVKGPLCPQRVGSNQNHLTDVKFWTLKHFPILLKFGRRVLFLHEKQLTSYKI